MHGPMLQATMHIIQARPFSGDESEASMIISETHHPPTLESVRWRRRRTTISTCGAARSKVRVSLLAFRHARDRTYRPQ